MRDNNNLTPRSKLAKMAENHFKQKELWEQCDAGRMSGTSSRQSTDFSQYSDEDLIRKYLTEETNLQKRADDR